MASFKYSMQYCSVGVPASAPGGSMMTSGDPVMDRIQTEIRTLTRDSGPRAELRTGYRERSGEAGLSELKELTGSAEVSTSLGNGRIKARAEAVVLDAGRPSRSGLARFGRNATPRRSPHWWTPIPSMRPAWRCRLLMKRRC